MLTLTLPKAKSSNLITTSPERTQPFGLMETSPQ